MRSNKWKHPNAYKHGVFNQITIVPGENPKEFAALLADLVHEWKPDGPTEEDAVLSIAQAMWRKRRAQTFLGIQLLKNICNPRHPAYDEYINLTFFAAYLRNKPETAFEEYASRCLQPDMIRLLEQKFPRSNFKSTAEWTQAIIDEIETVLIPERKPPRDRTLAKIISSMRSAASFTDDLFNRELVLDERLDAMIDRAVKRLVQTKAMKQALGQLEQAPAKRTADQSGKVVQISRTR